MIQLNNYGVQDTLLTSKPQISFWKAKTKRYGAFATESTQVVWNNSTGFGKRSTAMIQRSGDLVSEMWLEIDLPDLSTYIPTPNTATNIKWAQAVALIMINSIQLEVGSVKLDQYQGYYHDLWTELSLPAEKKDAFDRMVGKYKNYDNTSGTNSSSAAKTYFVPLLFFTNTASSQAIPSCALQYNEIRVNIELRNYLDCVVSSMAPVQSLVNSQGNPLDVTDVRLYVDFVYLSAPEKNRFISYQHDILYTYMQDSGQIPVLAGQPTAKIKLSFSNLVQEFIFVFQPKASFSSNTMTGNQWTNVVDAFALVDIQVDGSSRFTPRPGKYFTYAQPFYRHTACPTKPVHCYSFARHPEQVQPSSTLNASRLSALYINFQMQPNLPDGYIIVFARTFNLLTVSNGRLGLKFA